MELSSLKYGYIIDVVTLFWFLSHVGVLFFRICTHFFYHASACYQVALEDSRAFRNAITFVA